MMRTNFVGPLKFVLVRFDCLLSSVEDVQQDHMYSIRYQGIIIQTGEPLAMGYSYRHLVLLYTYV